MHQNHLFSAFSCMFFFVSLRPLKQNQQLSEQKCPTFWQQTSTGVETSPDTKLHQEAMMLIGWDVGWDICEIVGLVVYYLLLVYVLMSNICAVYLVFVLVAFGESGEIFRCVSYVWGIVSLLGLVAKNHSKISAVWKQAETSFLFFIMFLFLIIIIIISQNRNRFEHLNQPRKFSRNSNSWTPQGSLRIVGRGKKSSMLVVPSMKSHMVQTHWWHNHLICALNM